MARFSVANELLRDLGSFVREEYPDHVDLMLDILGSFSAYVARKYG
jgi:L-alanine-DL-glutamate epimerase-like enolase superfamily enzyme